MGGLGNSTGTTGGVGGLGNSTGTTGGVGGSGSVDLDSIIGSSLDFSKLSEFFSKIVSFLFSDDILSVIFDSSINSDSSISFTSSLIVHLSNEFNVVESITTGSLDLIFLINSFSF